MGHDIRARSQAARMADREIEAGALMACSLGKAFEMLETVDHSLNVPRVPSWPRLCVLSR